MLNNFVCNFFYILMKCLRSLVVVSRMDRVRNEEVRRRDGIENREGIGE